MGKKKDWNCDERKSRNIPVAVNNLIVCCGVRTEYNFFTEVGKIIKANYDTSITGINFDVETDPIDPLGMAKKVDERFKESMKRRQQYHQVWVVFDKDDFKKDNFDNAVNLINKLNEAHKDDEVTFHALWSNECIELWFVLHFILLESNILRTAYMTRLTDLIGEKYQKNDPIIFEKLIKKGGKVRDAIRNAKKLIDETKTPSNNAPATRVFEFFELYKDYIR